MAYKSPFEMTVEEVQAMTREEFRELLRQTQNTKTKGKFKAELDVRPAGTAQVVFNPPTRKKK